MYVNPRFTGLIKRKIWKDLGLASQSSLSNLDNQGLEEIHLRATFSLETRTQVRHPKRLTSVLLCGCSVHTCFVLSGTL